MISFTSLLSSERCPPNADTKWGHFHQGLFHQHCLSEIMAWISNYIIKTFHCVITPPCPSFKSFLIIVEPTLGISNYMIIHTYVQRLHFYNYYHISQMTRSNLWQSIQGWSCSRHRKPSQNIQMDISGYSMFSKSSAIPHKPHMILATGMS